MNEYIRKYQEQLEKLPSSGYKTQLQKYGNTVLDNIIRKSILFYISDIYCNDTEPCDTLDTNGIKSLALNIKIISDLGLRDELMYKNPIDIRDMNRSINLAISEMNSIFLSYISLYNYKEIEDSLPNVLNCSNKLLIVGNDTIPNLPISPHNVSPKFVKSTKYGNLIYHSQVVPLNKMFMIDLNSNKLLKWTLIKPLALEDTNYIHKSKIELLSMDLINLITIV